jgi:nucleoside-diphosphate-sugar epimerase
MVRVFVAGATGAIGKQLVPRLVAAGHEVHGMTRSESKQAMLCDLGAVPVIADALDPDQVAEAVARARPEVIVDQLTAIGALDTRHFDRDFALTNRLRTGYTRAWAGSRPCCCCGWSSSPGYSPSRWSSTTAATRSASG